MNPSHPHTAVIPVSLCIVTNELNEVLKQILEVCLPCFGEVLIGYDGNLPQPLPAFTRAGNVRMLALSWEGFGATKNKLAMQARHDWILSLDGDEVPTNELLDALGALPYATLPVSHLFSFRRLSFFEGHKVQHGAWGRDKVLRLYNRTYTRWNNAAVHETLERKQDTEIRLLKGVLLHYTADTYDRFLEKNRKYAQLSADKYFMQGKQSPWWKRLCSPAFTFLKEYLFMGGFRDGRAGWKIAGINARYTYWKYAFLKEKYKSRA